MIVYDFYNIVSSAFDIGLGIKHEQSTKQPHRIKDLPLKECIDLPAAEMQILGSLTNDTGSDDMHISHHFCIILDLSRMPMSLRPRSG